MISSISGIIKHKDLNYLIVDVSGVGYKVWVPLEVALNKNEEDKVELWTHMVVRENSQDLFGFLDKEWLTTFELLITVPGIGPKTALGILNVASPSVLRQAVASGDTSYLTRVSGIGKKNAEKIVLELKNKLKVGEEDVPKSGQANIDSDVVEALLSLGYNERDAREVLKKISNEVEGAGEKVKQALKILANHE